MSNIQTESAVDAAPAKTAPTEQTAKTQIMKPRLWFDSLTFSGGDVLNLDEDEIVVFVGPNNAGKSAALREMQDNISKIEERTVIRTANLQKSGTPDELRSYLEQHAQKIGEFSYPQFAGFGYTIPRDGLSGFDNKPGADRSNVASFFSARLTTENRIIASNPAISIALYESPPQHPIHLLMMNDVLAASVSEMFRRAFGTDLTVFRAGGGKFPLLVGDKPARKTGEDELTKTFVDRLRKNTVELEKQGDGMRSFTAVLLHVLVADHHSIQFLDEPEAFLHPPQARLLGEFIAREKKSKSQLFIATHSTDILDGLITGGAKKLRIVRIQRKGSTNRAKELSREKTNAIVSDTLLRFSGVFSGIFYQHVVICEADSDCLFYSSLLNTDAVSGNRRPDILFIHTAGKHRMAKLADTLRDLDVPVSVIADIDVLSECDTFRELLEKLGGDWNQAEKHLGAIKKSVQERHAPLDAEQVATQIRKQIADVSGTGDFPRARVSEIKKIFRSLSPWDAVKRSGRSAFSGGESTKHFDALTKISSEVGLWIVPVGELEGFCRSVGGHGPGFVAKVLEERSLEDDPELREAREFVTAIWKRAQPSQEIEQLSETPVKEDGSVTKNETKG